MSPSTPAHFVLGPRNSIHELITATKTSLRHNGGKPKPVAQPTCESMYLALSPLTGAVFWKGSLTTIQYDVSCGLFVAALYQVVFSSITSLLNVFIMKVLAFL